MPFRPVILMRCISDMGITIALAVYGSNTRNMEKFALTTQLAPKIPVFEDRQSFIKACASFFHLLTFEQNAVNWQVINTSQAPHIPG